MNHHIVIASSVIFVAFFVSVVVYMGTVAADNTKSTSSSLAPEAFMAAYTNHQNAILIDIRTAEEYDNGHIADSVNIDYYHPEFLESIKAVLQNKTAFIYCRSGNRSTHAAYLLKQAGVSVVEMDGGVLSYTGKLSRSF